MKKLFKNKRGQAEFGNLVIMIAFLLVTSASGIIAGIIYYEVGLIDNTLHTVNFKIPIGNNATISNNTVTDFQGILAIIIYPIMGLRTSLPYLIYFMIFGFIMAIGMTAYMSSKNPVFFVLHILFSSLVTYFSIILSGAYVTLLQNQFINQIMTPFTIYNKLMIFLPQITFFTALLFGVISFISLQKPLSSQASSTMSLQYGGDY